MRRSYAGNFYARLVSLTRLSMRRSEAERSDWAGPELLLHARDLGDDQLAVGRAKLREPRERRPDLPEVVRIEAGAREQKMLAFMIDAIALMRTEPSTRCATALTCL
jgi:hypothetical protein